MGAVLIKAFAFVAIIAIGYGLKRIGFFHAQDFYLLSKINLKLTLPAAIIANFSKISMDVSMLIICVIGMGCNAATMLAGYLMSMGKDKGEKTFNMLNLSGYNIGSFTTPFVQNFLGPVGVAATSLFDTGNAVMCTGINFTVASMVSGEEEKPSPGRIARTLLSSLPFDVYVIMTCLTLLNLRLPAAAVTLAETMGGANAFIAMLMIGIGFEIRADKEKLKLMIRILTVRFTMAVAMAAGFYLLAPLELEVRQAIAICVIGPITSICPAYVGRLKGDVELASAINSLAILIGVVTTTVGLVIML
ncbi:MAG: AEC family transporter [Hungatella sp.]|nr:AEC family transporter [Hungatella sp.]